MGLKNTYGFNGYCSDSLRQGANPAPSKARDTSTTEPMEQIPHKVK